MCSISGIFCANKSYSHIFLRQQATEMSNCLKHRGPDDFGNIEILADNIFFFHNRLSIIDLSKNGLQPMTSPSGRYTLIFNGEIYNHFELKKELKNTNPNIVWKGTSDTEILLQYIEHKNFETAIQDATGMFAAALWDNKEKKLILVRDRFGEKPIYYYISDFCLYFSSEIKSFKKLKIFKNEIDVKSLESYLSFGFINSNNSIYKNIKKIEPGCYLEFTKKDLENKSFKKNIYWKPELFYKNFRKELKLDNKVQNSYQEICSNVEALLQSIIAKQLVADVNVGTFLSGGIDSSLITYLAQQQSSKKIKTFSISFDDQDYDEGKYSKAVSKFIGTEHTNFTMTAKDLESFLISDETFYDEPFFDLSQFPTLMLCKLTKKQTNVALTGDGGDEVFGGYNRYILSKKIIPMILKTPIFFRKKIKLLLKGHNNDYKTSNLNFLNLFLSKILKLSQLDNKKQKIFEILNSQSEKEVYFNLLKCDQLSKNFDFQEYDYKYFNNITNNFMINDIKNYLANNILYKIDTASMYFSLETRAPFLDHKLFEYISKIPLKYLFYQNKSKSILKKILENKIPKTLINRPKMGFDFPIIKWVLHSANIQSIFRDLFHMKIDFIDSFLKEDLGYKILNQQFEINKKNIFYIWKIVILKKWFLKKFLKK